MDELDLVGGSLAALGAAQERLDGAVEVLEALVQACQGLEAGIRVGEEGLGLEVEVDGAQEIADVPLVDRGDLQVDLGAGRTGGIWAWRR